MKNTNSMLSKLAMWIDYIAKLIEIILAAFTFTSLFAGQLVIIVTFHFSTNLEAKRKNVQAILSELDFKIDTLIKTRSSIYFWRWKLPQLLPPNLIEISCEKSLLLIHAEQRIYPRGKSRMIFSEETFKLGKIKEFDRSVF